MFNGRQMSRSTLSLSGVAGLELNQLNNPFGIARNPLTGTLYIADRDNHRIMSYAMNELSGTVVAGGSGPGIGKRQLHSPIGVYFDAASDSLLIVNYGVHNIVRWKLGMMILQVLASHCTDRSSSQVKIVGRWSSAVRQVSVERRRLFLIILSVWPWIVGETSTSPTRAIIVSNSFWSIEWTAAPSLVSRPWLAAAQTNCDIRSQ